MKNCRFHILTRQLFSVFPSKSTISERSNPQLERPSSHLERPSSHLERSSSHLQRSSSQLERPGELPVRSLTFRCCRGNFQEALKIYKSSPKMQSFALKNSQILGFEHEILVVRLHAEFEAQLLQRVSPTPMSGRF